MREWFFFSSPITVLITYLIDCFPRRTPATRFVVGLCLYSVVVIECDWWELGKARSQPPVVPSLFFPSLPRQVYLWPHQPASISFFFFILTPCFSFLGLPATEYCLFYSIILLFYYYLLHLPPHFFNVFPHCFCFSPCRRPRPTAIDRHLNSSLRTPWLTFWALSHILILSFKLRPPVRSCAVEYLQSTDRLPSVQHT